VLVRHRERLRRAFAIGAPYLGEDEEGERGIDYRDYGPQMSRAFRALKVWMVLRSFGAAGLGEVLAKSVRLARHVHALVREHPDFEVLHEPALYVYSFRYVPNALADRPRPPELDARIDALNEAIAQAISRSGLALLMTTRIRGRVALRMSICSHRTLERDVDVTFEALAGLGRRLAADAGLDQAWSDPLPHLGERAG